MTEFHISDSKLREVLERSKERRDALKDVLPYLTPPDAGDIPGMMKFEAARRRALLVVRDKQEQFPLNPCPLELSKLPTRR